MTAAIAEKAPLFPLGNLYSTPGALAELSEQDIARGIARHWTGDWGDVCAEDKQLNNEAVTSGFRMLSAYTGQNQTKFWIITEADRSATTVLLPDEY